MQVITLLPFAIAQQMIDKYSSVYRNGKAWTIIEVKILYAENMNNIVCLYILH